MEVKSFIFLPFPRQIAPLSAPFNLTKEVEISFADKHRELFHPAVEKLKREIEGRFGLHLKVIDEEPSVANKIVFGLAHISFDHPQGYRLLIGDSRILIQANDAQGAYYAVCTLTQMLSQLPLAETVIPGVQIEDWPDFLARGVMLDISRDKVYKMQTLFDLVNLLSTWKINQLQLYTEHTFAYQNHPLVWKSASPMSAVEIRQLDEYCQDRFIELVPNQNSFGHMERWLKHTQYQPLAEITGDFVTSWGETKTGPYSLAPVEPGSLKLIGSLYEELLPNFTSAIFNVGCDETFDLGKGKSAQACNELGTGRVYLEFLLQIHQLVRQHGKTMQFWGDIILKYPEFLNALPRDCIGLIWGYEANHPFDQQAKLFSEAGLRFYVCPGTSTWNSLAGRTDNAIGNLTSAAINGVKYEAEGYLVTDWGDNGHWQPFPVFYLGFVVGASLSWCVSSNLHRSVPQWLDQFVYLEKNRVMGQLACDLGNADHDGDKPLPGNGGYFWPLQWSLEQIRQKTAYHPEMFINGLQKLREIKESSMGKPDMSHPNADVIWREFTLLISMMEHACHRALFAFGNLDGSGLKNELEWIIQEYQTLWLMRNRSGGLDDSLARLQKLMVDYP